MKPMEPYCELHCQLCGHRGLEESDDGFFYCTQCNAQAEDLISTAVATEDVAPGGIYLPIHSRKRSHVMEATPICQHDPVFHSQPKLFKALGLEGREPQQIEDFVDDDGPLVATHVWGLSFEDYHTAVRMRYLLGLQIMLQLQCESLVDEFRVTPRICDFIQRIWLPYVDSTQVLTHAWPDEVIDMSEQQHAPEPEGAVRKPPRAKYQGEPFNFYGKRCVMIWYRDLSKKIPLDSTLAVLFLACHLAREAVLPTDIAKWANETKLPYVSAFVELDKRMGPPEQACPISSKQMFNPSRHVLPQKIEAAAAKIAGSIGLSLPPVNFFEIASRYLRQLKLPHDKILPKALKLHEWSMPPGLWLSTNELRFPTRLCVLSILIVAIRMSYNINAFGYWERSLCNNKAATFLKSKGKAAMDSDYNAEDATKLLRHLHSLYTGLPHKYEHEKDLRTYLEYCKNFVFAGLEPSLENYEERTAIEKSWDYYQKHYKDGKDPNKSRDEGCSSRTAKERDGGMEQKCLNPSMRTNFHMNSLELEQETGTDSTQGNEAEALRILKLDMEEKRFHYIPPRKIIKSSDYVRFVRKKDDGALAYVADADYYILLRACAQLAQVDIRIMHMEVLNFEKRLSWIEDKIESTLHMEFEKVQCEHCQCGKDKD